jgi:diguanylate cyclase (GGDEF)-like protein
VTLLDQLDAAPRRTVLGGVAALAIVIGVVHGVVGAGYSFDLFYLLPVCLAAWRAGQRAGLAIAGLAAAALLTVEALAHGPPTRVGWNAAANFGTFAVVAVVVAALRSAVEIEAAAARTDFLTGLPNLRAFRDVADLELKRLQRFQQPLTVAYLDLDNFKAVNDRYGHPEGDALLRRVAEVLRDTLRATDIIARVGGDEFAILLPFTGAEPAWVVLRKLHNAVRIAMHEGGWPVTASVGALTCAHAPESVEELLRIADDLMYGAKRTGKNRVTLEIYRPPAAAAG